MIGPISIFILINVLAGAAAWRAGRWLGGGRWTDAVLGAGVAFFGMIVAAVAVLGFAGAVGPVWFLAAAAVMFVASLALPQGESPAAPRVTWRPAPVGFFLPSRRWRSRA